MEWKDVIDWLKDVLPTPLRAHFTIGVMVVGVFCLCTIFVEGFEWGEVFWVWWIPVAAAAVCLYWAITVVVVRKSIRWRRAFSWMLAAALTVVLGWLCVFGYRRYPYRYEKAGFFASRTWQPDNEDGPGFFEWTMEPATDVSKSTISITMAPGENCDLSQFEGPSPVRDKNATHEPNIKDDSTIQHPNTLWKVSDLHRGEELTFHVYARGHNQRADSVCITPIVSFN